MDVLFQICIELFRILDRTFVIPLQGIFLTAHANLIDNALPTFSKFQNNINILNQSSISLIASVGMMM